MWKIVKDELSYWKLPIIIIYGVSSSILYFIHRYVKSPDSAYDMIMTLTIYTVAAHLLLNLVVIYTETKENRIKRFSGLPLPIVKVGRARLFIPLMLLLFFVILLVADMLLMPQFQGLSPSYSPYIIELVLPLIFWMTITYALQLMTELYGRILLLLYIAFNIMVFLILPIFKRKLSMDIADNIQHYAFESPHTYYVIPILAVCLILLIQVSFMHRKTYLR